MGGLISVAALFASACSGDDDDPTDSPSPVLPSGATAPPSADADAGEFEQLAAAFAGGVDGHVAYAVESENYGTHPSGTWSTYRLDGEVREDWAQDAFGYEETSVAIKAADGFYFCNQTPFTVTCDEQPTESSLDIVFVLFTGIKEVAPALLANSVNYTVTELPDETIAGQDASCFDVAVNGRIGGGQPGKEQIKFCFSEEGALLSMLRTVTFDDPSLPDAWISASAQEAGDAVATDFDLPADPTLPPG